MILTVKTEMNETFAMCVTEQYMRLLESNEGEAIWENRVKTQRGKLHRKLMRMVPLVHEYLSDEEECPVSSSSIIEYLIFNHWDDFEELLNSRPNSPVETPIKPPSKPSIVMKNDNTKKEMKQVSEKLREIISEETEELTIDIDELEKWINAYYTMGIRVVPIDEKTRWLIPKDKWKVMEQKEVINKILNGDFPSMTAIAGILPDNIMCLDFDKQDGGMDQYNKWIIEYGVNTLVQKTGNGRHLFFRKERDEFDTSVTKVGGVGVDLLSSEHLVKLTPSLYLQCSSCERKCGATDGVCKANKQYSFINMKPEKLMKEWETLIAPPPKHIRDFLESHLDKEVKVKEVKVKERDYSPPRDDEVSQVVSLIDVDRMNTYDYWLRIGMALKQCGRVERNEDKYLELWDEMSQVSGKYNDREILTKWGSFVERETKFCNLGTLKKLAKKDSPEEYKKLFSKKSNKATDYSDPISLCVSGTHHSIGKLFELWYGDDFLITEEGVFRWDEDRVLWVEENIRDKKSWSLRLCDLLLPRVVKLLDDNTLSDEQSKSLSRTLSSLQNVPFLKSVGEYIFRNEKSMAMNDDNEWLPMPDGKKISLKSLELIDRTKADRFTYELNYEYKKTDGIPPLVRKYLESLFPLNPDIYDSSWFQILLGYSLTNLNTLQQLIICHGHGSNGKGTLCRLLVELFPKLVGEVDPQVCAKNKMSNRNLELLPLKKLRAGFVQEMDDDISLDSSKIKRLTGDDELKVLCLFQNEAVSFRSKCKLFVCCNDLPKLDCSSTAMRRRIRYLPFKADFNANPQPEISDMLLTEAFREQFFSYILEGARLFMKMRKLPSCEDVEEATSLYQGSMDYIKDFIESACYTGEDLSCQRSDLYRHFCNTFPSLNWSQQKFNSTIIDKGIVRKDKVIRKDGKVTKQCLFLDIQPRDESFIKTRY